MKTYLLGLLCLLAFGARAQVQLGQETFEGVTSDVGYTTSTPFAAVYLDPPSNTIAAQYFQRIQQAAGQPYTPWSSSNATLGNQQGSYFWGAEGVRGTDNIAVRPAGYVQLNPINTSLYNNLKITVAFSAPRGAGYPSTFGVKGVKRQDQVLIQYSFDGTNFTNAGRLTGDDPTTTNSGRWKRDVNMSGDASDDTTEPILNMNFTDYQFTVAAIGSQLWVRIVADYADITAAELAFDNIRVSGTVDTTPRPVLALDASESGPISYTEGDPAVPITNTLAITYPGGSGTLTGATVQILSGYVASQDVLSFSPQNGISASSNANGTLTLTGTASLANYQAALRSITYQNTNGTTATGGARAIGFTVRNGTYASNTPTRTINVTAVLNAPAPLPYTEDFETDGEGTRYTASTFASSATQTGFFRATASPPVGPGGVTLTNSTFTGYNGSGYWFGRGARSITNPTYPLSTLQLAPVNATNTINLRFTLRLGRGQGSQTSGWEPDDYVKLFYRTSSTGNWVLFGAFYGNYVTGELRRDANLDGQPDANGTLLTSTMQDVVFGTNNEIPNSAAVAALDFKIETASDDEEVVFDYIRISGTRPPTVTTATPSALTGTSALLGGNVTADGGSAVTERGVVYSTTNTTPTIGGTGVTKDANSTTGTGAFSETIGGLTAVTTYYVRAYALNTVGTSYGAVQTFTTPTAITSLARAGASPTNAASVSYTLTFANSVTGLSVSNFSLTAPGLTGASIASVAGAGTTYTVVVNTGTGDGLLTLNLSNTAGLSAGVSNALPFVGETYTIDKTAPTTTTVGIPPAATYGIGQVLSFTVNYSEAVFVTGTPQMPLYINGQRLANYVSGSGTTALLFQYTVQSGDNNFNGAYPGANLALNGGTIRDAATNNADLRLNGVPTSFVLVDGVAPTVTSLTGPAASGTTIATTPFSFTVRFSETVTNFSASGITVTNGTVTSGPTGTTDSYTFTVTPTTPGTVTMVAIAAGAAKDQVGNPNAASAPYSLTYLPPNVALSAISARTPSPTATATVSYQVTFSGSLTGLGPNNFNLTTTGSVTGASVASVSGSGATYTVVVNTGTGDGTLRLNLNNSTGTVPGISGLPYTSGPAYTITKSFAAAPTLRIQAAGSPSGNSDVTAFVDLVQVQQSGGTLFANGLQNGSFETNNVPAGGFLYSTSTPTPVVASPWTFSTQAGVSRNGINNGFGSVAFDGDAVALLQSYNGNNGSVSQALAVPTGSYQVSFSAAQRTNNNSSDQVVNVYLVQGTPVFMGSIQPSSAGSYQSFTSASFNVTAPALTATVSTTSASPTSILPIPFAVSFSPLSVGSTFTVSDVTVTGGTLTSGSFAGSGNGPYTFTVTPSGPGTVSVSVAAGVASDANNTFNSASNTVNVQFQAPTITVAPATLPGGTQGVAYSQTLTASGGTAPYTFSFTGALPTGLTLTPAGLLSGTPTATGPFTFTVTATDASATPGPFTGTRSYSLTIGYPDLVISTSGQIVPAGTYHSLTVQRGGVGTLAGDVTVTSDVTVQSGGVLNDGCALISGTGSFTLAAGGTLSICSAQGISNSGTTGTVQVTGTRSFNTDALYTYTGSVAQMTGTGLPSTVRALTLINPAGLSLTNALVTTTAATFTSGVLTTGANTLTLGSGATLSEDADGYVTGTVLATRSLATAGSPEAFGGLGLMLTPSGTTLPGSTLVRRVTGTALSGTSNSRSITRYFDIQPTVKTGLNVALVLTARDDERNGIAPANLRLFKSENNGTSWLLQPATYGTATANGLTTYSASLSGISDFSLWTLGDAAAPLPVTLTRFQGLLQDENLAVLRWATASELHSSYFAVERSLDGHTFVEVGRVAAAGTSFLAHTYELRDPLRLTGLTYYRLRQVDTDKSATYSQVITLAPSTHPAVAVSVYPNPRLGMAITNVTVRGLATQRLTVQVTDMLGRAVSSQPFTPATSQAILPLALPADLAAGVYSVSVSAGPQTWTTRLIIAP